MKSGQVEDLESSISNLSSVPQIHAIGRVADLIPPTSTLGLNDSFSRENRHDYDGTLVTDTKATDIMTQRLP